MNQDRTLPMHRPGTPNPSAHGNWVSGAGPLRATSFKPRGPLASLLITLIWTSLPETLGDNQVVAWGLNRYGVCDVPTELKDVVSISSGYDHALALRADGSVRAWGSNLDGERDVPPDLGDVVAVFAGDWVSYALRADGALRGWGGPPASGYLPVPDSVGKVVTLSIGSGSHVLALRHDGTVAAWGGNDFAEQLSVPANLTRVVQVAAGYGFSLALTTDGQIATWGDRLPFPRPEATNVVAIAAGWLDAFLLQADGRVVHWGRSDSSDGSLPSSLTNVTAITAGSTTVVALRRDGTVVQWPPIPSSKEVVPMPSELHGVSVIAARGGHALALIGKPVIGPPEIRVERFGDGCAVRFQGSLGRLYQIEFRGLYTEEPWKTRAIRLGGGGELRWESDLGLDAAFYRLMVR